MSFLGRFLATSAPSVRFSLADLAAIAYGGSNAVSAGIAVTRETALTYGPWWRGVTLLAADCGKLPLYLYRHTPDGLGKDRDPDHMAYYLCRYEPNPHQTDFQFREQLTGHAVTRGNGYAFIERLGNGDPVALWPLDPSTVTPVRADGRVWYVVSQDGTDSKIPAEDVFHLRGFSDDGLVGYSVVERARESLGLAMAQRKHTAIYYRNSAKPAVVLETPATLKPLAVTALREAWERGYSGLDNAHRTAVLDQGLQAKVLSFSAEDSQLIESRQFEAREIALFLGIPPHKIGDPSATAYNSRESENQDYLDQGLDHWLVRWEGECRKKLLTEQQKREETHSIEFLRAALLRGDMVARGNYFRIALGGVPWMTVNEVRGIENMNPEDGGDKLPQPLNMGDAGGGPGPDPGDSRKGKALPPPEPEPVALLESRVTPNVKAMSSLRQSLASAAGRMVRRVGAQARKAACHHAKYQQWLDALVGEQTPVFADALASLAELAGHVRGLEIDGGAACLGLLCDLHDAYAVLLDTATPKGLPAAADALAARLEAELPQSLLAELMGEG